VTGNLAYDDLRNRISTAWFAGLHRRSPLEQAGARIRDGCANRATGSSSTAGSSETWMSTCRKGCNSSPPRLAEVPRWSQGSRSLQRVPNSVHDTYHGGLDKILPRQRGTAYYENLGPAARQQMQRDLADYTKAFDTKNGTQLYDSMTRNGILGP
jgi:hypothetical protein